MNSEIQRIYDFWFGDIVSNPRAESRHALWYMGGEAVDTDIRNQFEALVQQAQAGELADWQQTAQGSTALIILLDQFPLNMYRGEARAFASEQHSVAVCLSGIENGQDRALSFYEKTFFYLPLEHSEAAQHQQLSIKYFTQLRDEAPPAHRQAGEAALEFAISHKAIVDRFGRYPHRNKALGRVSTAAEIAWLESGGETYGQ